MKIIFQTDGACSMKRRVAAGAAVWLDPSGRELGYWTRFLQHVTTPIAEYTGLILALERSLDLVLSAPEPVEAVEVWMDAELIVRQVTGVYATRSEILLPLRNHALAVGGELAHHGVAVSVLEFPKGTDGKRRWSNERADELAGQCREAGRDLSSGDPIFP